MKEVQDIGNGLGDNTAKKGAGYALEGDPCHGTEKASGCIGIASREIPISKALRGWHVGLRVTGCKHYAVWFGKLYLGEIDVEAESFDAAK